MGSVAPGGFRYRSGPYKIRRYLTTSATTFRGGQLVTFLSAATSNEVGEVAGTGNTLVGVAVSTANSYGSIGSDVSNYVEVLVPEEDTVFESKVTTVATSNYTPGAVFDFEKFGNYHEITTSANTPFVVIVPRDDGTTVDSTNSTVLVCFLKTRLEAHGEIS